MASIRSLSVGTLGVCAVLAGCEPTLMSDWNGNNRSTQPGTQANSSGNSNWNSPRWAANNPQQPAQPNAQQPNANAQAGSQGNVQQGPAPWGNNPQGTQPPPNNQVASANGAQPAAVQPGPINGSQAPVCEDTQPRALAMPGESCARPCRGTWQRCFDGCNAGQDRSCVAQCDDAFRECMRGCY